MYEYGGQHYNDDDEEGLSPSIFGGIREVFKGSDFKRIPRDDAYPKLLALIPAAQDHIWMRGPGVDNNLHHLAAVGSHYADFKQIETARVFVEQVLKEYAREFGQPLAIIASLEKGLASAIHWTALNLHNPTVGVLATPINRLYPTDDRVVAKKIDESQQFGNAIISWKKRIKDGQESSHDFYQRNGLIAWVAAFTLILSCERTTSGIITTARRAHRARRPVMYLDGSVAPTVEELLVGEFEAQRVVRPKDVIKAMG